MTDSTARARALPDGLPAACTGLVLGLRGMKDAGGFTLAELARATAISKSSWERYLNGKQFPPRQAVRALCKAAQRAEDELLAQWALADAAWSRRGQPTPAGSCSTTPAAATTTDGVPARPPAARRFDRVRRVLLAASALIDDRPAATVAGVLVLCTAMVAPAAVIHASRPTASSGVARPPVCQLRACEGRDPHTTACEDPVTTASHTAADGAHLDIRFSPRCRAGWIRIRPTHPDFRVEVSGPDSPPQSIVGGALPTDEVPTTAMVAAPHPANLRACYYPSSGYFGRECFTG